MLMTLIVDIICSKANSYSATVDVCITSLKWTVPSLIGCLTILKLPRLSTPAFLLSSELKLSRLIKPPAYFEELCETH